MTATDCHADLAPSQWVERHADLVFPAARVLDVGAGHGRHALFFAARGARVLAIDRDAGALATFAHAPGVTTRAADLEAGPWPLAGETFDAIVVVHYLHRPLWRHLIAALAPDGAFLYETFAAGNEQFGPPTNPDFLLQAGELLDVVRGQLTVVAFEQGLTRRAARPAVVQRIAAVGLARAWPPPLDA